MGIAKLYGQKASGTNINGILKDYHAYAGENISAGDLVEYINGISSSISATDVSTYISSYKANAVQLDENRIAVTYYKDTKMLCCTIITIQNLQISIGTEYSVSLSNTFTNYPSIALIDTNKLLIFFNLYNSSYSPTSIPCAVVATVSGATISFGSVVQSTSNNGYVCLDLCKVDTDKAVAGLYYAGNDNRCSNWVITVSGTVPSLSATVKVQNYYKTKSMTLSQLDTNKFLMSWSRDSTKASICIGTVSGTSISYSVSTVSGGTTIYMYNTCVINKSKFVYFIYDSTASCCIGVGSISGSSITLSDKIALNMNINEYLRAKALDETRVAFAVSDGQNSGKATLRVATVEGNAITLGTSFVTSLSSRRFSYLDSLIEGQLFALHSNNSNNDNYLYLYGVDGTIISNTVIQNVYEQQVRKTTTSKFDGIAKTGGKGATLYTDNILSTIWTEVTAYKEYVAENGIRLTALSSADNGIPTNAFDGNENTWWSDVVDDNTLTSWIKLEFPKNIKINKLLTYIGASGSTGVLSSVKIQGSNDDTIWTDIYTLTSVQTQLTELVLNNGNFYKFYRFYVKMLKSSSSWYPMLREIKITEYETRDLVGIYTLNYQPTYVDFTSNILPTSWIDTTRQNATASNDYGDWNIKCSNNSTQPDTSMAYAISKMVDNNTGTFFKAGTDRGGATIQIRIALPEKVTINVSSIYINQRYIGSDSAIYGICDDGLVELGKLTATETQIEETLTISNDYYFNTIMLKLSGFGENTANWQPFIFDFKINKGTLRIENN